MQLVITADASRMTSRIIRVDANLADPSPGLERVGFFLLVQLWERIVRRPIQAYSGRYLRWLIRNGEISGKLWGILSGDLLGQSTPIAGAPAGADLGAELAPDGQAVTVGHINPASEAKARGFAQVYQRKFGEWPYSPRPGDEAEAAEVLQEWLSEAVGGGEG